MFKKGRPRAMMSELEMLFSSAARVQVLRLFLLNPGAQYYQREIERETGQPIRAVQRETARLSEINLLSRTKEGNRVFYKLNPGFALLDEMAALFQKAMGRTDAGLVQERRRAIPKEPSSVSQPFDWMETDAVLPLPEGLVRLQVGGDWDRAY